LDESKNIMEQLKTKTRKRKKNLTESNEIEELLGDLSPIPIPLKRNRNLMDNKVQPRYSNMKFVMVS
jgi:hypothetical protein